MVPLHINDYIVSVNKIRDFMFGDLEKTLSLVNTPARAPNFLLALALCCYTEYWGQFLIIITMIISNVTTIYILT